MTFFSTKYRFSTIVVFNSLARSPKDSLFTAKKRLHGFCDFHSITIVVYMRFVFFVNYTYSIKKIIY